MALDNSIFTEGAGVVNTALASKIIEEENNNREYNGSGNDSIENPGPAPQNTIPEGEDIYHVDPLLGEFQTLKFESSVEMLATIDENIREKRSIVLYPWQIEESERLCFAKPTNLHPFKYSLCAANGSGKDAFVIAPWAVWFITSKIRSLCIITSSSGVQLSNQTEAYIRNICNKINNWTISTIGMPVLKIRRRQITSLISGSHIILFATDEEGKAEGYHPLEPNAEMAIIVNEAKSVPPEIFRALRRCTGYNYWLNVSTPGEPIGDFAKSYNTWPNTRRITYYDCPRHHSPEEFELDKKELGEHSPLFRSKWLALFTFIGGKYVINADHIEKLMLKIEQNAIKHIVWDNKLRIGLDIALSSNGDETSLAAFKGNKMTELLTCREQDSTKLVDYIDFIWLRGKLKLASGNENYIINADDGGVGRAVIDQLKKKGWKINRILNQSRAKNNTSYGNRGAELWYKSSRLIEQCLLIIPKDEKLLSQLRSRKFKDSISGVDKLTLQAKKEMIGEGLPSPDRADGLVLALADVNVNNLNEKVIYKEPENKKIQTEEEIEDLLWEAQTGIKGNNRRNRALSLNLMLKKDRGSYFETPVTNSRR